MTVAEQAPLSKIVESAITALKRKVPYLVIRLGDGEALALESVGHPAATDVFNVPWNKHTGMIPSDSEKQQWIGMVRKSVQVSDFVGLHASDSRQEQSIKDSGNKLRHLLSDCKFTECSANIHLELLRGKHFEALIDACEGVHLVTGHDLVKPFVKVFGLKRALPVHWTKIPKQCWYFKDRTSWQTWKDVIIPGIGMLPLSPGWLFLVGGGVPGKAMFSVLKSRGGVVLDIGSVCDFWAGYLTRGKGKGPGVICSAHVLDKRSVAAKTAEPDR